MHRGVAPEPEGHRRRGLRRHCILLGSGFIIIVAALAVCGIVSRCCGLLVVPWSGPGRPVLVTGWRFAGRLLRPSGIGAESWRGLDGRLSVCNGSRIRHGGRLRERWLMRARGWFLGSRAGGIRVRAGGSDAAGDLDQADAGDHDESVDGDGQ
jgi:hypothetical protein